jgi:hypothetical protein
MTELRNMQLRRNSTGFETGRPHQANQTTIAQRNTRVRHKLSMITIERKQAHVAYERAICKLAVTEWKQQEQPKCCVKCTDVYVVALFVHKCMKMMDVAAVAAARQQPR